MSSGSSELLPFHSTAMPGCHDFDPWKDYLNLSKVVAEIVENRKKAQVCSPIWDTLINDPKPPVLFGNGTDAMAPGVNDIVASRSSSLDGVANGSVMTHQASKEICYFCKRKGEPRNVYSSHPVKRPDGIVVCPILRNYTCPVCGATKDKAHTAKYCPLNEWKQLLYRKGGRNSARRNVKRQDAGGDEIIKP